MTETIEKQILPEVKRYVEARNAYAAQLTELRHKFNDLYWERRTSDEAMNVYRAAHTTWLDADKQRYSHFETLSKKLAEETEDKLVKYIAEKWLDEYHEQAVLILEALPASLTELDKIAKDQGWCSAWGDAVDDAAEAGVIEMSPIERVTHTLECFLNREMGQYDTKRAMEMVDELVKLRVDEAVNQLAKTATVVVDALS
jgi:hypothetical protein